MYLINKFKYTPKVKILNYGVSSNSHKGELFLIADGTSKYIKTPTPIEVNFITINEILNMIGQEQVDLIQINIEGEEYPLLEQMLDDGTILKFSNIQIQYHTYIENAIERREKIQERMQEHFNKIYDVPFVFEGWTLK
jgi:FkbM family methyltransferase